jgi:hypothetical protein
MNFLYKLERKFGKYAIPNLMKYVVVLYAVGLLVGSLTPGFYNAFFALRFELVAKGQVWRLITCLIPKVSMSSLLYVLIFVYLYYIIGNALENAWGAFRFNLYVFSGILLNILASWMMYLVTGQNSGISLDSIYSSMFFAYAAIYPDVQFYLYFLIPVKVKYLARFDAAVLLYQCYGYMRMGDYFSVILITVSMANFLIFFFATRNYKRLSPREFERKARFRRQMNAGRRQAGAGRNLGRNTVTRHKCAVCGRTELDDDQLEFRFCSKCDGNYEYCMEHLFTHEHVKKHAPAPGRKND